MTGSGSSRMGRKAEQESFIGSLINPIGRINTRRSETGARNHHPVKAKRQGHCGDGWLVAELNVLKIG